MALHVLFARFPTFVFLALLHTHFIFAAPFSPSIKHSTHRTRNLPRGLVFESYHPAASFEIFGDGLDHALSKRVDATILDSATSFVHTKLGIQPHSLSVHSSFEGNTTNHAYIKQIVNGLPVANAVANVAFNKANQVVAFGSSFIANATAPSAQPSVAVQNAISTAEEALRGRYDSSTYPAPTLEYIVKQDGSLALAHVFHVTNNTAGTFYHAFVDAHTGDLVSVTDFVADATYRVLPIAKQILTEGFEDLTDPQDTFSSPLGWHNDGKTTTTSTAGNNAISFKPVQANVTDESGDNLSFLFTQDPSLDPTEPVNLDAARTNSFYVVNTMHDIAYRYGFTESAFNFQTDNMGKGGKGNDRVLVSVQMSPGTDNAYFATMADGINGQMRMYVWDLTSPRRDGALENDILVHENTHGITNRLTGGGTAACLQTLEAGGLGEGWSDAMAGWTEQTSATVSDYVIGPYITNNPAGIRTHPYSTDSSVNPLRYSSVASLNEVHKIGEVWANILYNVYAALVAKHGFSADAKTNPSGSGGNVVWLHLFIDALSLQPCNPTFVNTRDAWIQADVNRYRGANKCTLWNAFASRGLGSRAAKYRDDSSVPWGC